MRTIDKIIVHCTATPEGRETTVEHVTAWHKARGFRTIGYHYLIYLDGSVHAGRPLSEIGAHCTGENAHSIGVCYVGGIDRNSLKPKDTRTDAQKVSLRNLVADLQKRFPGSTVHGHSEFAAKACPCFKIQNSQF